MVNNYDQDNQQNYNPEETNPFAGTVITLAPVTTVPSPNPDPNKNPNPDPNKNPNPDNKNPNPNANDDLTRLSDLLGKILGQDIVLPATGNPVVVPNQTTSNNSAYLLMAIGVGAMVFVYYRSKHKHGST